MDLSLIVALITFLAVMLTSAALFFYLTSRESVHAWFRPELLHPAIQIGKTVHRLAIMPTR